MNPIDLPIKLNASVLRAVTHVPFIVRDVGPHGYMLLREGREEHVPCGTEDSVYDMKIINQVDIQPGWPTSHHLTTRKVVL